MIMLQQDMGLQLSHFKRKYPLKGTVLFKTGARHELIFAMISLVSESREIQLNSIKNMIAQKPRIRINKSN